WSGSRGASIAEHDMGIACRIRAHPFVDVSHSRDGIRGRRVVRQDRAGDKRDQRDTRRLVYSFELPLHELRRSPLIDIVDTSDDDDGIRPNHRDVTVEARANLIAALAVYAAIQDAPLGMRLHEPV